MDFGTPILFKYNLLKEIICTLDNISLIYFFTIFFFIFSVVSLCVFAQRLLKKILILTLIIYYFGVIDLYLQISCLISMISLKCGFIFPTIYSCFNFQLFDYPDPCFDQYTSFQYFIQPKLEIKYIIYTIEFLLLQYSGLLKQVLLYRAKLFKNLKPFRYK